MPLHALGARKAGHCERVPVDGRQVDNGAIGLPMQGVLQVLPLGSGPDVGSSAPSALSPNSPGGLCGFFHPALRQCFYHFTDNVPLNSWVPFARELGLTENEICVARAEAAGPSDALYVMLTKWVNKTGRNASIHTLLKALEMLGERQAEETIQDILVNSGKFIYQEDGTGATHVSEKSLFLLEVSS
ncbi:hypothetical protein P7K49_027562 [Saguinus oedipus]|uniref:Death domain-containing protein n=1 Tax=Saguinus oedipus TaxID=9490 RepID=A0ABQ9U9T0_SAGOE|nr:hypothetical protein P7K49_027562 [Saguinus oedipus]